MKKEYYLLAVILVLLDLIVIVNNIYHTKDNNFLIPNNKEINSIDYKAQYNTTAKNTTYNKSIIFFGDSITYGYYGDNNSNNGYSFANYISEKYNFKSVINAGKSGWLISNYLGKNWITDNVKTYFNKTYDYVIMHGGTNDIAYGIPLGTYSLNNFSGNYDTKTFIGGLEYYIYTIKKQWPNAKIGYIINYNTPNDTSDNRKNLSANYYSNMKKVLEKWNINYLDLYFDKTRNGETYSSILKVNTNTYLWDNLHLNKAGYAIISPYIYDWITIL